MRAKSKAGVAIAAAALILSGCSGIGPERAPLGAGRVNPAGANHLVQFKPDAINSNDLARLMCEDRTKVPDAAADAGRDLFVAGLDCFASSAADETARKRRRNETQFYLIMRSDQNCGIWMTYLERGGSIGRGTFNVLSVLTGGAGALVNGQAASILAGASGIASGTGAAIDAAVLHGMTEGLIFPRVSAVRAEMLAGIERHQGDDLVAYPMTRALADAVRYHAACNVASAFAANTPAAEFGVQVEALARTTDAVRRARLAVAGAKPASAADLAAGAIFFTAGEDVLTVQKVAGTGDARTVDYLVAGSPGPVTGEALATFVAKLEGATLLKPGS